MRFSCLWTTSHSEREEIFLLLFIDVQSQIQIVGQQASNIQLALAPECSCSTAPPIWLVAAAAACSNFSLLWTDRHTDNVCSFVFLLRLRLVLLRLVIRARRDIIVHSFSSILLHVFISSRLDTQVVDRDLETLCAMTPILSVSAHEHIYLVDFCKLKIPPAIFFMKWLLVWSWI